MKVLMLGWELPPYNSGGLGVACYQLCKALADFKVDIEFVLPYRHDKKVDFMKVTAAHPQDVQSIKLSGIAYDSYKYTFADGREENLNIFQQQSLYESAVGQMMSLGDYDVIHAHDWLTFRAALRAKQASNCPLIVHVHSIERDRAGGNSGNPLVREIEYMGLMAADRIIAVSEHTKHCIIEDYGIPEDKIEVVHNSIDIEAIEPLEGENAYTYLAEMKKKGYRVVVSIGRLTIQKNLVTLMHAAKEVIARAPKTIFVIVGSGDQYFELIELAADLGISKNVVFTGFLRGKQWRDAYAIGDVFAMPSVSEPFGLTPLEAISYGTPAVISKQSGVSEVLKNCLKVDFWDVNKLADRITAVVQNDSLRDELHKNSYDEFIRLSWADSAHKLNRIYERQVSRGRVEAFA
jgi:glycosyltransferase involved in cell wall biosynthesis